MGLLPQMHRNEIEINQTVQQLVLKKYKTVNNFRNIPNKYLAK